jgi:predicted porin
MGALVAAGLLMGGLTAGSASAADFGGNCCADLEERIAELEATTARKGNRKVSLTISGWVGEQIMWWDDGFEENLYVTGLGSTLSSHVKFTGQATISPGWYAGYVLHIEAISSDSLTISQNQSIGPAALQSPAFGGYQTQLLQSFWFVKSDHLGKVSVGLQSQASDNTAILVDGSGSLVPANWVAFEYNSFRLRTTAGVLTGDTWGSQGGCIGGGAIGDCNGATQHVVRYDSPTFAGFSVSASWGEDDMWDVAARYAGEFGGFKVAAAAAYNELSGGNLGVAGDTFEYFQAGLYIQHVPTGLFAYGAYGNAERDVAAGDSDTYYVKAGLRERWTPLGHSVLYGEWERNESTGVNFTATNVASSDFDLYGAGFVQEIDAAAMSLWISYRHLEYSDSSATSYEDFDYVKAGALINF